MERIRDAIQKARRAREGEVDVDVDEATAQPSGRRPQPAAKIAAAGVWESLPLFEPDAQHFQRNRVITLACEDPAYATFDILRTKIMAAMKQNGWRSLAITSPSPNCGKTMVAANLAFSFARQSELKIILVDADLRRPQLTNTLGLQPGPSMSDFLSGAGEATSQFVRYGANLAIGASTRPQSHAAETLANTQTRRSLDALYDALRPDVVIFDLPPLLASDDMLTFLPNVDCTLLVIEADRTTFREVDETEQELAEKSNLLGVVLNKCRLETEKYGYAYD